MESWLMLYWCCDFAHTVDVNQPAVNPVPTSIQYQSLVPLHFIDTHNVIGNVWVNPMVGEELYADDHLKPESLIPSDLHIK